MSRRRHGPLPDPDVAEALAELKDAGILEDSGERRPNSGGVPEVVWRVSALGEALGEYLKLGLDFEEAVDRLRTRQ